MSLSWMACVVIIANPMAENIVRTVRNSLVHPVTFHGCHVSGALSHCYLSSKDLSYILDAFVACHTRCCVALTDTLRKKSRFAMAFDIATQHCKCGVVFFSRSSCFYGQDHRQSNDRNQCPICSKILGAFSCSLRMARSLGVKLWSSVIEGSVLFSSGSRSVSQALPVFFWIRAYTWWFTETSVRTSTFFAISVCCAVLFLRCSFQPALTSNAVWSRNVSQCIISMRPRDIAIATIAYVFSRSFVVK